MHIERVGEGPIIGPSTHASIGTNIGGPSLVRMPDWATGRLGRYHLYFADHKGDHIRLAFADALAGPWTVHPPGSLQLADSGFLTEAPVPTEAQMAAIHERFNASFGGAYSVEEALVDATVPHIASPDVHLDHRSRRLVMYFHGLDGLGVQCTRAAVSADGVRFVARPEVLGGPYFRVFRHAGRFHALVMPGRFLRSDDGLTGFEAGPTLFGPTMRHSAVVVRQGILDVLFTRVGDGPEAILWSRIELGEDWMGWRDSEPVEVLRPELGWEGADVAVVASRRGAVDDLVNQLRDPCLFVDDDGSTWLAYAGGGESGIGLGRVDFS